jgi:hypothetical protein
MLYAPKQHLLGFNFKWTSLSFYNTNLICYKWSFEFRLCMLTSSPKTFRNWLLQSLNTSVIILEKVLVVFLNLNGITFHSKNLVLMMIAIFLMFSGAIGICQNLNYKSRVVNHVNYPIWSKTSSISNMGNEFVTFVHWMFYNHNNTSWFLQNVKIKQPLSFLTTIITTISC